MIDSFNRRTKKAFRGLSLVSTSSDPTHSDPAHSTSEKLPFLSPLQTPLCHPQISPWILYLTDKNEYFSFLEHSPYFKVASIYSTAQLYSSLFRLEANLVLMESHLSWQDPLELIHQIHSVFHLPVIMLWGDSDSKNRKNFLKKAFTNGLTDSISSPFSQDELWQALHVLLQLR